jgi:hypothetical protein
MDESKRPGNMLIVEHKLLEISIAQAPLSLLSTSFHLSSPAKQRHQRFLNIALMLVLAISCLVGRDFIGNMVDISNTNLPFPTY